ncbi:MAG: hypothetical protein ACLQGV_18310 [Bryobacteraceae bacterium]
MYSELRVLLILVTAAAALASGWFALSAVTASLMVFREGRPSQATPSDSAAQQPDAGSATPRQDSSRAKRALPSGFLYVWVWPATLTLLAMLCCAALIGVFSVGGGGDEAAIAEGRWSFSPQPPPPEGGILLHSPASEVKAPLFWSLLGVAAFCMGVFGSGMEPFNRLWTLIVGVGFILITGLLAWNNATLRVSADLTGLRSSSALGWRQVRWDLVKNVELREITPTTYHLGGDQLAFPGISTMSFVFSDADGRTLLHMSTKMQPKEDVRRFFDLVRERTGLFPYLHNVKVPNL